MMQCEDDDSALRVDYCNICRFIKNRDKCRADARLRNQTIIDAWLLPSKLTVMLIMAIRENRIRVDP